MENWTNLCDLFFELSNEDRINILYQVEKKPFTITALSKSLNLSTQEVSRHVSRLMDQQIVTKDSNGEIILDSYGRLYFQYHTSSLYQITKIILIHIRFKVYHQNISPEFRSFKKVF